MNDIKRLIIVACCTIVLVLFGFFIKNHADVNGWKTAYKYNIAIPAEKKDEFNYDVDSRQGLVITRGDFKTVDGTKFDEMSEKYTYVEKVHEHYTMHTQTYSCGKSTCIRTYYTWDRTGSVEKFADKTTFFGRDYPINIFVYDDLVQKIGACSVTPKDQSKGWFSQKRGCRADWGDEYYYEDNNDRYYYNALPLTFTASFLTDTSSGTVASAFSGGVKLENKSIEQMRKDSTSYKLWHNVVLIFGSVIILIAMSIFAYQWVMADGKWSLDE